MNSALELNDVSKHYPGFSLEGVSFTLPLPISTPKT